MKTLILFTMICSGLHAQTVKISGKVIDAENNSPVVGASVVIEQSKRGTSTDVEGQYFLAVEKGKTVNITISSVGYSSKTLNDITASNEGQAFNVSLERANTQLNQVTVRSNARKESVASLYLQQKNSSSISDGISSEVIRKSPDRNTGDVLKRVSGAAIQDNKFVVIRGLSERYNTSLLNNAVLPSTEPDKKAFSFDIIPSSVIDNLVIYKSATPDLPGDFAGGAIKISTKDYPSRRISELSASISYNNLTTFKNFYKGLPEGKGDWAGYFDNSRLIPNAYYQNRYNLINLNNYQKTFITKLFPNTYGYTSAYRSLPNVSVSYTGGDTRLLNGDKKFGYIYTISYGQGRRISDRLRDEFDTYNYFNYRFNTNNYEIKSTASALLNLTYSYGRSKISWKNLFNNDFTRTTGIRNGYDVSNGIDQKFLVKSVNNEVNSNGILNSVVEGSHSLNKSFAIDWNASYGKTYRWQPDQKILAFHTDINSPDYVLTLSNENSPEIRNAGRVYSFLNENIYGANVNATKEFQWLGQTQKFKIGTSNYYRERDVEVHALGYSVLNGFGNRISIPETKATTYDNIFDPQNVENYHLTLTNIPTNSTDYNGTALMNAGYAMFDSKFSDRFKLTWGARVENYKQELQTRNREDVKLSNFDVLPSALVTYSLSTKTNLRASGSQSVNRPEFRELADYSVYDYDNNFVIRGNPNLVRAKNTNADLRYEWFPSGGEIVSVSVFYKYFDKPIEQVNLGNDVLSFANANNANAYGLELELRKRLDFISNNNFFKNLTFYANAAYIKGSVQFADQTINSPLQGQSPYLVNGGLTYAINNDDFSVNVLYNRVGPRLRFRAVSGAAKNIFEKPRDVMDIQLSKKFFNKKLEARLTLTDVFAPAFVWYYKFEENPSKIDYNPSTDRILNSIKYGSTTSLSLRYSLGK